MVRIVASQSISSYSENIFTCINSPALAEASNSQQANPRWRFLNEGNLQQPWLRDYSFKGVPLRSYMKNKAMVEAKPMARGDCRR